MLLDFFCLPTRRMCSIYIMAAVLFWKKIGGLFWKRVIMFNIQSKLERHLQQTSCSEFFSVFNQENFD